MLAYSQWVPSNTVAPGKRLSKALARAISSPVRAASPRIFLRRASGWKGLPGSMPSERIMA